MILRKTIFAALPVAWLLAWVAPAPAIEIGTILVPDLRVRSGPGKDYRILFLLPEDARVSIVDHQDKWLEIEHNGRQGYIFHRQDFIEIEALNEGEERSSTDALKNSTDPAESIKGRLRRAKSDLASISRKEKEVLEEFNAADEALNSARQQVRATRAGLAEVQEKIDAVKARSMALGNEIRAGEGYAATRLVALYKLNWVGRVQLLATADSFFDFVTRREALERILKQDEALLEELNRNKTALESLMTQLNTRGAEKRALELTLSERVTKLSAQQKKRKKILQKIRSRKSLELAAIKALRQSAAALDATIESIETVTPGIPPSAGAGDLDKPFKAYKGLLSWPVKGKIISFFGPYRDKKYEVTNFESGINIQAERGEPIRSVSGGHVIFSSWFKGFGNMMIIDHGEHYYTVYAHLEEVFKVKGDRVDQGEVIATVGDSGSMSGPALHFEVRHHGKPIDPLAWIQKG